MNVLNHHTNDNYQLLAFNVSSFILAAISGKKLESPKHLATKIQQLFQICRNNNFYFLRCHITNRGGRVKV